MIPLLSLETPLLQSIIFLGGLLAFCIPVCYLLASLFAKRMIAVDFYTLAIYMSSAFFIASFAEPLGDIVYKYFLGEYLWTYQFLPIFAGASTVLGFITWPFYGYYAYFLHQIFYEKGIHLSTWKKGFISAVDGVPFDMLANLFSLVVFGFIFFYYPSPELWHLSSLWVIPLYLIYGIALAYLIKYLLGKKKTFLIPLTFYTLGCLIMFLGDFLFRQFFF